MATHGFTRRAALLGLGAFASAQAGAVHAQTSGFRIRAMEVDTAPLLAQSGNPTASWAQQALTNQLQQVFGNSMAPGDPGGATLRVRVNSIYLGGGGPADPDIIRGVATLGARTVRIRTIAVYTPSPTDQAMWEQSNRDRVAALAQSFAYALARRLGR
jgi:hypothetical protein